VRYQVKDVARSVDFYTRHFGFTVQHQHLPDFASISLDKLTLLLSGPSASGSRKLSDGTTQEPGGYNRIVLHVRDLHANIKLLETAGLRFRNTLETGPGGKQIRVLDADGNPIELFEPARA
jgi:glyoxylase I family protein